MNRCINKSLCLYLQLFILWSLLRIICYQNCYFSIILVFAVISYSLCSIKMSIILIILCFKLLLNLFQVVLESIIRIIAIIVLLCQLFYMCHSHYLCRFLLIWFFSLPSIMAIIEVLFCLFFGFYYLRAIFLGGWGSI